PQPRVAEAAVDEQHRRPAAFLLDPEAHVSDASLPAMRFAKVLVVGAGQMGGGIAQVVAASGRRVLLHDPYPGAVERGLAAMERSLEKLGANVGEVIGRVEPVDDLGAADLMIEAVVEDAA